MYHEVYITAPVLSLPLYERHTRPLSIVIIGYLL